MEYEELEVLYGKMGLEEFGRKGMNHASSEQNILQNIPNVASALTGAAIVTLVMHYNIMKLYSRNTNFLIRAYINAVNHGVSPSWHDDTYIDYLEERNKSGVKYRSLEKGLEKLVDDYEKEYKKSLFFTAIGDNSWNDNTVRKGYDNFANYGNDEKPLFYGSNSLIGFSEGFIGTDKKIYFSTGNKFSVKYENIIDIYFEYYEYDTKRAIPLFRIEDMKRIVNQLSCPFSADNIYWYVKILYYDEITGKVCCEKFSKKVAWDNEQNTNFAWRFIGLLKDTIFLKNYDKYIEARKKIDPEFAAEHEAQASKPKKIDYKEVFGEMSVKAIGAKCKELLDIQYNIVKSVGIASSAEIDNKSMDLIQQYIALGLTQRINSFIADMRNASSAKNVKLAFLDDKNIKMLDEFVPRYSINDAINKFFEQEGLRDSYEKFDNSKGTVKKIEKAKKSFAELSADEVPLAYLAESILGFSKGSVFTNKMIHFNTDKNFTVPYEYIAEIYIQNTLGDKMSIHTYSDLERYCKVNPDGWKSGIWYFMIVYYNPHTEQLHEGRFKNFSTTNIEYAEYTFKLANVIMDCSYNVKSK